MAGLLTGISGMAGAQADTIAHIACGDIAGLDAAITAANAGTGPSTIVLASGCVYTLATAAVTGSFGPDGLPIIINTVTLIGHGTTIQRGVEAGDFRIAEVDAGGTLTVEGITVRNGIAELGGCYLAEDGGALVLENSTVVECTATDDGGGIYLHGSEVAPVLRSPGTTEPDGMISSAEIDHSTLVDNSADDDGGAISGAAGSTVKLSIDYVARNEATLGGAIFNDGIGLFVGASDLTQNHASEEGGGIYNSESEMHVAGSQLVLNSADVDGGGIANYGLSLLQNSTVDTNTAPAGGGIWQGGGATVAVLSQITGNMVDNCGPLASVPGCVN